VHVVVLTQRVKDLGLDEILSKVFPKDTQLIYGINFKQRKGLIPMHRIGNEALE